MKAFNAYLLGYILSVILTAIAFGLMYLHLQSDHTVPPHELMVLILVFLAVAQFFIQLVFFLHLGQEEKPMWNSITFVYALFIVAVLVGGTLWIMNSLEETHDLSKIYPTGEISPQGQDD